MGYETAKLRIDAGFQKLLPLSHPFIQTFLNYGDDFGGATSWANLRILHGGLRYLQKLDLVPLEALVLGGCDVSRRSLTESAGELAHAGVLSGDLIAASAAEASAFEARISTGFLDDADVGMSELDPAASKLSAATPRERIERVQDELERFCKENELTRCVVCNLASTEVWRERRADFSPVQYGWR